MRGYCEHAAPHLEGAATGPLQGLRFAVKDVFAVRGVTACYGNPEWLATHEAAPSHAAVVQQLLDAGASLHGLTLTDELALSLTGENAHYGTPENPAAPERVPGGSSSGSAAVVARGDVDFALGTDTGGSVRVPASHCGVLGLRPTHGAISCDGVLPLAPRFDTVGVFARSIAVLERVCSVLLPPSEAVLRRLAVLPELQPLMDDTAWPSFLRAAEALSHELSVPLVRSTSPLGVDTLLAGYLSLQNLEAASLHRAWLESRAPSFGSLIARRIGWLLSTDAHAPSEAEPRRQALLTQLARLLEDGTWLVLPTTPGAAPRRGLSDDEVEAYTGRALTLAALASLAGLPQLSLPLARAEGAPLGVSLLGPPGADRALLHASARATSLFTPSVGDCHDPQS